MKVAVRIRDYDRLRAALAARRRQLGLRQLDPDEKAGLQSTYVGKLEIGTRMLGNLSLPMLLAALDADLHFAPRRGHPRPSNSGRAARGHVQHLNSESQS